MAQDVYYFLTAPLLEPKVHIYFKRTYCFMKRLFDRAADRHHFASAFHCSCKMLVCCHEFIKRPARYLDYRIIDSWFKRSWSLLGYVVSDLIKCHTDRDLSS